MYLLLLCTHYYYVLNFKKFSVFEILSGPLKVWDVTKNIFDKNTRFRLEQKKAQFRVKLKKIKNGLYVHFINVLFKINLNTDLLVYVEFQSLQMSILVFK